ncbi:Rieske (2Fe-2S) protein [bacterium]|nr:Rieske (2Fe-2S) protein [bacterium]
MDNLVVVATLPEIPVGNSKCIEVQGKMIAVFHTFQGWFALDERCSHRGGPLSEGKVDNHQVTCPWHQARFDLRSGQCLSNQKLSTLRSYKVVLEGEQVKIELPDFASKE